MTKDSALAYAVVIPAFNAARTLRDAISSLLDQTVRPASIVVVDDGSTDESAAIATDFGTVVTLIRQANQGPAAATDAGIAASDAPIIAGLDADDIWFPDKAERQLARLAEDPDIDALFCKAASFRHGDRPERDGPARDMWNRSAMMIRRPAASRIGPVAEESGERFLGEMIPWLDRGRRLGLRLELIPEVLVGRRIIPGSLTYQQSAAAWLPMIRAQLKKRR